MKKLIFIFVALTSFSALAQTAYPLTCKFDGIDSAGWAPSPTAGNRVTIFKSFKHSQEPASKGVAEGYCAWADRGMYADEPTIIGQETVATMMIYEIDYNGTKALVSAPAIWAAKSKVRGTQITFNVYRGTLPGTVGPVLIIK